MHPAVPFGRNLRSVIVKIYMFGVFDPSITTVEVVRILKVFVSIFIFAYKLAWFEVVESEK